MKVDLVYFFLTSLNLWMIKSTASGAPLDFMVTRGLTAVALCMASNLIFQRTLFIPMSRLTRERMIFGGSGLVTQLFGLNLLPLSTYSMFVRITPL